MHPSYVNAPLKNPKNSWKLTFKWRNKSRYKKHKLFDFFDFFDFLSSTSSRLSVWNINTQSILRSIQIRRCQIKARIVFPVEMIVVVGLNWYVILLHSKRPRPGRSVSVTRIYVYKDAFLSFFSLWPVEKSHPLTCHRDTSFAANGKVVYLIR